MSFDIAKIEGFEWDLGNLGHIKRHNVIYNECEEVFSNTPHLILEDKEHSEIEERFQILGKTNKGRLLFMIFTIRKNRIRVISARDQNRKERPYLQRKGGELDEKA